MDSATRRVRQAINEYLDDVKGRSHIPISQESVDALQTALDGIAVHRDEGELTPGQREALAASESFLEEAVFEREREELSPGQREAAEASL